MAEKKEEKVSGTVKVKSALEKRVGLWEVDEAHESKENPAGEIFIKDKPVTVAKTAGVMAAIRDGRLVEV